MSITINNDIIRNYLKASYQLRDIQDIITLLEKQQTFHFPTLENGLFSASDVSDDTSYTGYSSVWIRDNIYVAYCHYIINESEIAIANIETLIAYIKKFRWRFVNIIEGQVDPNKVMERPHVRFDGRNLTEIDQQWEHAQNDAWGYFLWFYCKLAREKLLELKPENLEIIALFPFYFQAIEYWQDEDSGHWEEERKIAASSIGVVIAGLKSFKSLLTDTSIAQYCKYQNQLVTVKFLDELINRGTIAFNKILPAECIQPNKPRRYDAALLFSIYPLQIVDEEMSEKILKDVINNLQGDYGIKRYLWDSFWCRDYQDLPEEIRTSISDDREQWLREHNRELQEGEEAQWCIFDPIISAIYGLKYQKTGEEEYLQQQTIYLNRSLGQLTGNCELGEFKCPELYYLQDGCYIPNDATPLLWTQANLRIALKVMLDSLTGY